MVANPFPGFAVCKPPLMSNDGSLMKKTTPWCYSQSAKSVVLTGLKPGTKYDIQVVAWEDGCKARGIYRIPASGKRARRAAFYAAQRADRKLSRCLREEFD
jgi:hypothetical protein